MGGVPTPDAAGAMARFARGWQPMSSAPKDGSVFLGLRRSWDFPQPVCWQQPDCDDGSHPGEMWAWVYADWVMHEADSNGIDPEFWQPMPRWRS